MDFKFVVNPDYVFTHAINMVQTKEPFSGWGKFTNKIWEANPEVFYFLAGSPEWYLYNQNILEVAKKAEKILKEKRKSKEYQRLKKETEVYCLKVEQQWRKNKMRVLDFFENDLKLEVPNKEIIVFITHPKLNNGFTIDDNKIAWGHSEDYKNYSSVYLAHELMHILTKHDDSDLAHAVIELATDNELRIRLNKSGKYFEYLGHAHLEKQERKLYPLWKKFLKEDGNLFEFIKKMKNEQI